MDRRKFLTTAGLGLVAAAAPISIDAVTRKTRRAKTAAFLLKIEIDLFLSNLSNYRTYIALIQLFVF